MPLRLNHVVCLPAALFQHAGFFNDSKACLDMMEIAPVSFIAGEALQCFTRTTLCLLHRFNKNIGELPGRKIFSDYLGPLAGITEIKHIVHNLEGHAERPRKINASFLDLLLCFRNDTGQLCHADDEGSSFIRIHVEHLCGQGAIDPLLQIITGDELGPVDIHPLPEMRTDILPYHHLVERFPAEQLTNAGDFPTAVTEENRGCYPH